MNFELVKKENNQVTLNLTIPYADFEKAIEKAYQKEKSKFVVPGFRKGKAPRKTIENNYGESVFFEEAINVIFPDAYSKAVDELSIDPVDRPDIDILEIGKDVDLKIAAVVTVKPEVKLGEYKGVSVDAVKVDVTDEDVQKELDRSREAGGRLVTVEDRAVQNGDSVLIDYAGFVGEEQFEGGTAENQTLVIGSGRFIEGFEEQLIGKNIGDECEVSVTFPEKYHAENLAGKPATFKATIKGIKVKELPELDDEFAKDTSEFDTIDELKADIRKKLEEAAAKNSEMATRDRVVDAVVNTLEADIPEVMVNNEINGMLRDFDYELRYQGADLEKYLQFTDTSIEALKEQMKDDAVQRVKTALVIEEIAKKENIEISSEDIESELVRIAERQNSKVEDIRKYFEKDDFEYIKSTLTAKKVVDLLVDSAKLN
jgi:trigger factor